MYKEYCHLILPTAKPPLPAEESWCLTYTQDLPEWIYAAQSISQGGKIYVKHKTTQNNTKHLNHCTWECKYHVVFTPKYRKKTIFGHIRRELKDVFHRLATQKGCEIEEGKLMPDHIHMLISIPPKHAVSSIVGFIKGKSAIWVAQNISQKEKNFVGHRFWARGYFVSTIGVNEETIRKYIQNQEAEDRRLDQLNLFNRNK